MIKQLTAFENIGIHTNRLKFWLIGLLMIVCCANVSAKVKLVSFYFQEDNSIPTNRSNQQLEELRELMTTHDVQIIELNAFANGNGMSAAENMKLAEQRVDFMTSFFELGAMNIQSTAYGSQKIELNFRPKNWNRVDVYYFLGKELKIEPQQPEVVEQVDPSEPTVEKIIEEPEVEVPVAEVQPDSKPEIEQKPNESEEVAEFSETIVENVPLVLPINFIAGTCQIQSRSRENLEKLYNALLNNPQYNGHIRGHVCCENNRRMSKKRAKVVYDFLVEKGISKDRLSYKGYSNKSPIAYPEVTPKDRAANRRVEIVFNR